MDIANWVKTARTSKGWTQTQLGDAVGRTKANVGHWETGKHAPSLVQVVEISNVTGYPLPHLGQQLQLADSHQPIRGKVPLISWVQAGEWCSAADPHLPGQADRWMDCPVSHSSSTFALRVRGDSMTAPSGSSRTYPEGCYIFVDPERKNPVNGDRVVACLEGTDEVTFKVYKNEDGRQWLQPLNPSHEPIRESFHILGTVLGKWEDG